MKYIPTHSYLIGRTVVLKPTSRIIVPDPTKQTKYFFVDAVGPNCRQAKVGDLVVSKSIQQIVVNNGLSWRALIDEVDLRCVATDYSPDELLVQTDDGRDYVPFGHAEAAEPIGFSPPMAAE